MWYFTFIAISSHTMTNNFHQVVVAQSLSLMIGEQCWRDANIVHALERLYHIFSAPGTSASNAFIAKHGLNSLTANYTTSMTREVWLSAGRRKRGPWSVISASLRGYSASDSRDKFYALYGLLDWNQTPYTLPVDYEIDAKELSYEISRLYITANELGKLLRLCARVRDPSSPSWCLNLDVPDQRDRLFAVDDTMYNAGDVARASRIVLPLRSCRNIISIQCCVWDTVAELSDVCSLAASNTWVMPEMVLVLIAQWNLQVRQWIGNFFDGHMSPSAISEARQRTMTVDIRLFRNSTSGTWSRATPGLGPSWLAWESAMNTELLHHVLTEDETRLFESIGDSRYDMQQMFQWSLGKRVGGTVQHRQLALLPGNAEVGDYICVIVGYEMPWLIRPQVGSSPLHYKLVGPCYVDGIMDGEALKHPDKKEEDLLIA